MVSPDKIENPIHFSTADTMLSHISIFPKSPRHELVEFSRAFIKYHKNEPPMSIGILLCH